MQLLTDATDEINEKSDTIYEAYKDALAASGPEPEPLARSEGMGVSSLLDWMLQEFDVLGNILTNISDNSVVVSCENAFVLREHEGCQDLSKIADAGYQFPESSELHACSGRIQAVKKAFFCKSSGCLLGAKFCGTQLASASKRLGYYPSVLLSLFDDHLLTACFVVQASS